MVPRADWRLETAANHQVSRNISGNRNVIWNRYAMIGNDALRAALEAGAL